MSIFDKFKQGMEMRSQAKRMQAEVNSITAEYQNGGITVVAQGDCSIQSIKISPETWAEVSSGKVDRFETMLFNVVNGAIKKAREETQMRMAKFLQENGDGLSSLFGK
jgi:DNA-binding protein YbaB